MKKKPGVIDTWRQNHYKERTGWVHKDVEKKYISVVFFKKKILIYFLNILVLILIYKCEY